MRGDWTLRQSASQGARNFLIVTQDDSIIPGLAASSQVLQIVDSESLDSQRWGVAQVAPEGWHLFFKGGWGSGTGLVDHQVALLTHGRTRISLAITTRFNPDHAYGKQTLRGVARRLLRGLPTY